MSCNGTGAGPSSLGYHFQVHIPLQQEEANTREGDTGFIGNKILSKTEKPEDVPRDSLRSHRWSQIKYFFSSIGHKILMFFQSVFGKPERHEVGVVTEPTHSNNSQEGEEISKSQKEEEISKKTEEFQFVKRLDDDKSIQRDDTGIEEEISVDQQVIAVIKNDLEEIRQIISYFQDTAPKMEELIQLTERIEENKNYLNEVNEENLPKKEFEEILSEIQWLKIALENFEIGSKEKVTSDEINDKNVSKRFLIDQVNTKEINISGGIPNRGNSCYRNASNLSLSVCGTIMELIRKPLNQGFIESEKNFQSRKSIQKEFVNLIDAIEQNKNEEELLSIERRLYSAIAESGFSNELNQINEFRQQDAASYLEIIIGQVLNYQFREQTANSGTLDDKVYSIKIDSPPAPLVQVPILKGVNDLQMLVNAVYSESTENDNWTYNEDQRKIHFVAYNKLVKIISPPQDMLAIQLKRGVVGRVNQEKMKIPKGGILDFSVAHNLKEGELQYQTKSFIRLHAETGDSGHYTAYVNKEGQWYHYNDDIVSKVSQEKAEEEMALAYILFFEKIKK